MGLGKKEAGMIGSRKERSRKKLLQQLQLLMEQPKHGAMQIGRDGELC
jgi:hypothetical protein